MAPYFGCRGTPAERLLRMCIPEPNSGCWLWLGALCNPRYGYGVFTMSGAYKETAHRASWLIFRGPIPDGAEIDHRCRNPYCVNPEHLRPLTVAQNRALRTKEKSVCWKGHKLYADNVVIEGKNRRCRECRERSKPRMKP